MLERRWQDLRFAWRMLWRNRSVTAVAVMTLALGVGATTAMVSMLDTGVFRTLPVSNPERLVLLHWTLTKTSFSMNAGLTFSGCSRVTAAPMDSCEAPYPVIDAVREAVRPAASVAAMSVVDRVQAAGSGWSAVLRAQFVSGNFFTVLGVGPQGGRLFTAGDDLGGGESVTVLSERYWRFRLGADPAILGGTIAVNGTPLTIVGVAARGFYGVDPLDPPDLWIPLRTAARLENPSHWSRWLLDSKSMVLAAIARLEPNVGPANAQLAFRRAYNAVLARGDVSMFTKADGPDITLADASRGLNDLRTRHRRPLSLLRTLVLLVLAVSGANVATLLLARASTRRREIATRLAIGQGWSALIAQLLTEGLLLSALGAGAGLVVGAWVSRATIVFLAPEADTSALSSFNPAVLALAVAIGLTTTAIFGLAPAWAARRVSLACDLQSGATLATASGRAGRPGRWLVAGEMAAALVLLVGAGLFLRTVVNLLTADPGFRTQRLWNVTISPVVPTKDVSIEDRLEPLRASVAALPGVEAVTWTSMPLLASAYQMGLVSFDPQSGQSLMGDHLTVGPRFLATTGIPSRAGRDVEARDITSGGRVWINDVLATRLFGTANVAGRSLTLPGPDGRLRPHEIAGVIGNANYHDARDPGGPAVYFARAASARYLVVRAADRTSGLVNGIERIVREQAPGLMAHDIREVREEAARQLFAERLMARASMAFGGLAMLLAAVGIYGVLSYSVATRTREMAVRLALGAERANIVGLVLGDALRLTAAGAVIGLIGGAWASRLIASLLFGVRPLDPLTYVLATLLLAAIALIAASVPALRATRVDPIVALRAE